MRKDSGNAKNDTARLVVVANLAVIFMGSTLLTPLYPLYARKFEFSELTLTLIYAIYVCGNLTALFSWGGFRTSSAAVG